MFENYALIVFKHQCSLEDSIRLFCGTKLYGLPIITKNYSKQIKNPDCHDQQKDKYVDKIYSSGKSINNNQKILSIHPTLVLRNINLNENVLDITPIQSFIDKSSKYQHNTFTKNLFYISEYNPLGKSQQSHKNYQKSKHSNYNTMHISNNNQDSYNNQSCNYKPQHYNIYTSFNRRKSTYYHKQEPFFINRNNFTTTDRALMYDLKNILYKKNTLP